MVNHNGSFFRLNSYEDPFFQDPNQLQALLSVYPWHIDTLLQMAAIYQQQGGRSSRIKSICISTANLIPLQTSVLRRITAKEQCLPSTELSCPASA